MPKIKPTAFHLCITKYLLRAQIIHSISSRLYDFHCIIDIEPFRLYYQIEYYQFSLIIYTTSPTQHHLHYIIKHYIINITSSTHHHLHNTTYTTPSTLHHLHNTIYITSSNTTSSTHTHTIYITSSNTTSSTHTHTICITSSTQYHQHNLINTSPSTQHHLHNTSYTTPATQHHLLYIMKHWQVQHLEHCHITPTASFLLIPLLLFFVVDCSLLSFIDPFHS